MATKISSYLTKLGFRQLEHVADAANYNNETGGEYIVIRENTRIYLYDATSNAPIDSINVLPTSDGGTSRWMAIGGGAMTQYKINYTFESYSNEIPLGMTVLSKANIFYVNIENTQILSTEFNLNDAKDTIVLSKPFEAGVRTEVVIFVGDYQPESRDYELLTNKPIVNGITLVGNRSLGELGIQPAGDYATNTKVNTVESTLENKKADKATTLAGYNIGDAYTKTEVDSIKTNLTTEINKKANSDNVYTKSEIDTTVADLNQKITDKDSLPEQAGNADKFLTTNGTEASWAMIDKTTVGLNNVDNTSDLNKPISTAVQEALDSKADKTTTLAGYGITDVYTKEEIENTYAKSVDIPTKVSQLENDSGYSTEHQDISGKADTSYVNEELAKKQDVISDLDVIRQGASKGATAVNYDNITNCITKIPQDIKLELIDDTLTLKAGSKVYVPNGAGRFYGATIGSDLSTTGYHDGQIMIFAQCSSLSSISINAITETLVSNAKSGTSPEASIYYNTSLNMIYRYTSSSAYDLRFALPIAICTRTSGKITSIDQVFNGFGYIGSTVFALPGVKGLIPNGRNSNDTLKNIEFTVGKVRIYTNLGSRNNSYLALSANDNDLVGRVNEFEATDDISQSTESKVIYSPTLNKNIIAGGTEWKWAITGQWSSTSTSPFNVTSLTPKTTFHAVDYNDSSWLSGLGMSSNRYINLTLGASGSEYTAPANGWFYFEGGSTSGNKYAALRGKVLSVAGITIPGISDVALILPVKKGDVMKHMYSTNTSHTFRFVYAEGDK